MTHLLGLSDGGFGLLDRKEGPDPHTVDGPPVIHPRCHTSPQTVQGGGCNTGSFFRKEGAGLDEIGRT